MRVLGSVLAGALALITSIEVQAGSLGPSYHPMPNGWDGDWRRAPSSSRQWNRGPVSPHWVHNGPSGWWACCPARGVPTYWVRGASGGAFDYPFADWRGPTGGWGNP